MERKIINIIGEKLFHIFVWLVAVWIVFAFSSQMYFVYLHFTGQDKKAHDLSNQIMWKIDGRFKNDPDNIWYEKK